MIDRDQVLGLAIGSTAGTYSVAALPAGDWPEDELVLIGGMISEGLLRLRGTATDGERQLLVYELTQIGRSTAERLV